MDITKIDLELHLPISLPFKSYTQDFSHKDINAYMGGDSPVIIVLQIKGSTPVSNHRTRSFAIREKCHPRKTGLMSKVPYSMQDCWVHNSGEYCGLMESIQLGIGSSPVR